MANARIWSHGCVVFSSCTGGFASKVKKYLKIDYFRRKKINKAREKPTFEAKPVQAEEDLERIKLGIEFLKDACLRGQSFNVEVKADGSISLLNLKGGVTTRISKAEGLNFLNNARDEIKASENEKIRSCIEPRINMILQALLSSKPYRSISIIDINGFVFDLSECKSKNRNVECNLTITSKEKGNCSTRSMGYIYLNWKVFSLCEKRRIFQSNMKLVYNQ